MRAWLSDQAGSYPGEGRAELIWDGRLWVQTTNVKSEKKKKKDFKGCTAPARPAEATGARGFTLTNS